MKTYTIVLLMHTFVYFQKAYFKLERQGGKNIRFLNMITSKRHKYPQSSSQKAI